MIDAIRDGVLLTLLLSTISLAVPGVVGAMGGLISESAGIMNLGAQGLMTFGAFFSVVAAYYTNDPWIGVLCGILAGAFGGFINMLVTVEFGGHQMLFGLGFNALASGIAAFFCRVIWNAGRSDAVANLWSTDCLKNVPYIGEILAGFSPLVYLAILIVFGISFFLYKTTTGLRIRAVGNDPRALETAGVNVWALRGLATVLSGAIMGYAGAFLSLGNTGLYIDGLVAGKGMLAFVTVKMGSYKPKRIVALAIVFAFFEALQMQIQINSAIQFPPELVVTIPYVAALIILMFQKETRPPKAVGKPFMKRKYNLSFEED